MKTWLVLDSHFLCYRAFHTAKELTWKGKSTGVIFGFLKDISRLKDEFHTDRIAFCFEHPHLYRRDVYPQYKMKRRKELTSEEQEGFQQFKHQIKKLRTEYLPRIGFNNVFSARGMESDDLMATICKDIPDDEEVILVTADSDMWQCLKHNVSIYSPITRKLFTGEKFVADHMIAPSQWAWVKAIAGCSSDGVEGIKGVGEKTALKYLGGTLKNDASIYQAIKRDWDSIVKRNLKLVTLPWVGCPVPLLQEDELDVKEWREVCSELGMRSLKEHPPVATRRLHTV